MIRLQLTQKIENSKVLLTKFAYKFTSDPDQVADLVQETLIRAVRHTDELLSNPKVGSWLYVIMKNIYINQYRKAQNRILYEQSEISALRDQGCLEPYTYNQAENRFTAADIQIAMNRLPADTYEIFTMYMEGFKYREIAEHCDMPEGTIKTRIFHAKKMLRKSLAAYERKN